MTTQTHLPPTGVRPPAPVRCGLTPVLHGGFPGDDRAGLLRQVARIADEGGFDILWVEDHTRLPAEEIRASEGLPERDEPLEAWTTLAFLAASTRRIRLGTEVTPVTLRHPALLAKAVATLDVLSGGRVVFGAGTGWHKPEFTSLGIPFERRAERFDKACEALSVMQALWRGGVSISRAAFTCLRGPTLRRRPCSQAVHLSGSAGSPISFSRLWSVSGRAGSWAPIPIPPLSPSGGRGSAIYVRKPVVTRRRFGSVCR
jgi:alkanesulfonate monooxygenase SsuD/methylene tetrahydromethanopterin reductase-like flavin-dependent oxidoreductase (luciferase family)